jgi:hypothetical protein
MTKLEELKAHAADAAWAAAHAAYRAAFADTGDYDAAVDAAYATYCEELKKSKENSDDH